MITTREVSTLVEYLCGTTIIDKSEPRCMLVFFASIEAPLMQPIDVHACCPPLRLVKKERECDSKVTLSARAIHSIARRYGSSIC